MLTKQSNEELSLFNLPDIFMQIEELLGYKLEKTGIFDSAFKGYYLMSNKDHMEGLLTKENAEKVLLLGVPNSIIPKVLNKFNVIGLTQLRFTPKDSKNFFASDNFLQKKGFKNIMKYNNGYSMAYFSEFDNQENALAQTIIKYISMYDAFIKTGQ